MNLSAHSTLKNIRELRKISLQFGEGVCSGKIELLNMLSQKILSKPKDILLYQNTLLGMLAWPENKEVYELTERAIKELSKTEVTGHFSYAIVK